MDVLKQSGKLEEVCDVFSDNSPVNDSTSSAPWTNKTSRSRFGHAPSSDCNSMSADSPTSRHSGVTQHSVVSTLVKKLNNLSSSIGTYIVITKYYILILFTLINIDKKIK